MSELEFSKQVVRRFNTESIEQGLVECAAELMTEDFVNRTAPANSDVGAAGMLHTFNHVLRPALADLKVTIHEQIAEGDLATTRKTISGRHVGPFMGIAATNRDVQIEVIDIVRLENGRYKEHWGLNTLAQVLAQLRQT